MNTSEINIWRSTDELASVSPLNSESNLLSLQEAQSLARQKLQALAQSSDFSAKMKVAFGETVDVTELQAAWAVGDFTALPLIEVRSRSDINGANGAYAKAIDTIFISQEFLNQNAGNVDAIASVVLEEIGHAIDVLLNSGDSLGDEGAIFSALVRGETLTAQELAALRAEDDSAIVTLDGQVVAIEQDNIVGTDGNDTLNGTTGNDTIDGLGGNDIISGLAGDDSLIGGQGNDQLNGAAGDDTLFGTPGNDTIDGLGGNDQIFGLGGNDSLDGNLGNDTIDPGLGIDTVNGGDGNDLLVVDYSSLTTDISSTNSGNSGTISTVGNSINYSNIERMNLSGGSGNDTIFGTSGNDTIFGNAGRDYLVGNDGDDSIDGGANDDTLDGGSGNNTLNGGAGDDTFNVIGTGTAIGGDGNDIFILIWPLHRLH